jgi:hypothetical protein
MYKIILLSLFLICFSACVTEKYNENNVKEFMSKIGVENYDITCSKNENVCIVIGEINGVQKLFLFSRDNNNSFILEESKIIK